MPMNASFSWSRVLVPILAVLGVAAICGVLYLREADVVAKSALDRETRRTEIFAHFYVQDVKSIEKDLRQLTDGDGLQAYLLSGKQDDLARAIHRAQFFGLENPDYDQVRYLDERGQEVLRINHHGAIVPPNELQNKADRPYFQKTMKLAQGQYYVSAFDLNVEHGQVEQPPKPTLRVAMPVFDANGRRHGIYIVNDLGANIISRLETFSPQYQQRFRMLNAQGYWLKAARPDLEWGFILPSRAGATMAQSDPDLWRQVARQPAGQTLQGGGVFTWHRVAPLDLIAGSGNSIVADDDFIVIAAEITPTEWNALFTGLRQTFLMVALVLLVPVLISLWFFQLRQRVQVERDRFFTLTRDMLCVAGFDGYFKRVNPAWENALGYDQEEMLRKPFIDFVHPDDREKTRQETASLARGGEVISFENRYRCRDGSYRWLLWNARSLVSEKLIFASARDLTERKGIEEQILKLNDEQKQRAQELEAANRELEAFSYSVSHDLRAPLRHIHGFVEILQKAPAVQGDEASRRHMAVIAKAAKQMGMLIDDLLAFSRTGRAEMHLATINQRDLLEQVIRELEPETQGRQVSWDLKPLPQVRGDPSLLRLVWTNLVSNALKYTRLCDTARIEIGSVAPQTDQGMPSECVFYIRDNGVGFDMQYVSKLFGVFQRLHRVEDFEGTGIGLANVQRIIHRHGGRVWAESHPNAGATFYFSLPTHPNEPNAHVQNKTNPTG